MSQKNFAIKRINKDLKEIQQNPLNGVGICFLDPTNPFQLLVNIKIMHGRYENLLFHILLDLPEQYPCKPPKMLIYPGQPYNSSFHHHILKYKEFTRFCIDLLDEAMMSTNVVGTGWSPGYTFSTLLMQIQNFLADPDFHDKSQELSDQQIQQIHQEVNWYSYTHYVGDKTFKHSTKCPYPPIHNSEQEVEQPKLENVLFNQVKQRISCFMTTDNYIDNPWGIFGYPIHVTKDKYGRLQQKPIPEILSYEGFQNQLNTNNKYSYLSSLETVFKTGMGEGYNEFLPIFLNKNHYLQSKKELATCLARISNCDSFESQVLQVLPNLINKMLVALLDDSMHQSISAIEAYVHFTQLFHYIIEENEQIRSEINNRVKNMIQSDFARSKEQLGDLGEFLVILCASQYAMTPSLLEIVYREQFARQVMWIPRHSQIFSAYNYSNNISKKLEQVFKSAKIGNKLLIFNLEAAKKFALDKEYLRKLAEERYSVIPEVEAEQFIKDTRNLTNSIDSHVKLMSYLGLSKQYPNEEACHNLFKTAIYVSNIQGYTHNFNLQLVRTYNQGIAGSYEQPIFKEQDLLLKNGKQISDSNIQEGITGDVNPQPIKKERKKLKLPSNHNTYE